MNAERETGNDMNPSRIPRRERGAVLIVALMFLVILTLLGISSMTSATFEERMAGNSRDYNIALQAAEAAIKDAEYDLNNIVMTGFTGFRSISGQTGFGTGAGTNDGTCSVAAGPKGPGLCMPTATLTSPWAAVAFTTTDNISVPYGTFTGASTLPFLGVSQQPRYIITGYKMLTPFDSDPVYYYEVTARAWGANTNTQVTLQTFFRKP